MLRKFRCESDMDEDSVPTNFNEYDSLYSTYRVLLIKLVDQNSLNCLSFREI